MAAAFVFVAALLSGCMQGSPPGSAAVPAAPAPPPAAAAVESVPAAPLPSAKEAVKESAKETVVTVGPGDTLYSIARAHNVPIRELIQWNGLDAPYELKPGRTLRLPAQRVHVVASGDTVYSISRRYGADMTALTRANGLEPPYSIAAGQKLRLPPATIAAANASPAQAGAAVAPASAAPAQAPAAGPAGSAVEAVPLPPPAAPASAAVAPKPEPAAVADVEPQPAGTPMAVPDVAPEPKPSVEASAPAAAPISGAPSFLWPVRGKILSAYGAKKGGEHNDGINIEASRGAPVRAAADGTVIYAGNELRGFGNLILVKHDGGWTTAYAHNDTLLVASGVPVKRGQVIAKAGSTGNVPTPQVHFELRRGTRAVNPGDYLTATAEAPAVNRVAGRAAPPDLE